MDDKKIIKIINFCRKRYGLISAKKIVEYFINKRGYYKLASGFKLGYWSTFDKLRKELSVIFNVSEKDSQDMLKKLLINYDIKEKELAQLRLDGTDIFINSLLAYYYKDAGKSKKYTSISDKLKKKVNRFKESKLLGIYDRYTIEDRLLPNDGEVEIINEKFGVIQYIILCDLLVSYLDFYENDSLVFGFEKRRFDLHHYKGNQNELALIYYNTYNKLEKENSKEYNSKNISFVKYIRDSLFLFTTESNPYSEFNPNNKTSYENSCQSIRVQAKGTSKTKSTNDIKGYEGSEEYFLAVLKEHNLINLRE